MRVSSLKPVPPLLLFIIFLFSVSQLNAQKKGFIINKDGTRENVAIVYDKAEPGSVQVEISKNSKSTYLPSDLRSFGFAGTLGGSITYVSVASDGGDTPDVFMRQLVPGAHSLLELHGSPSRFFYQTPEGVREILENDLSKTLGSLADNKALRNLQPNRIRYNRASLISFFKALNQGGGASPNFGNKGLLFSGLSGDVTLVSVDNGNFSSSSAEVNFNTYSFGLSAYLPVKTTLRFGLNAKVSFEQFSFYQNTRTAQSDQDATVTFNRALLELTPTYKLSLGRLSSYVFAGMALGYVLEDQSEFFIADFNNNEIQFSSFERTYEKGNQHTGITGGLGISFQLTPVIISGLELSWHSASLTESSLEKINTYKLSLNLGF